MAKNLTIRTTITDPSFDPLFDSDSGSGFQQAVAHQTRRFMDRLETARANVQRGKLATLEPSVRLRWRKEYKKALLNAFIKHKVYHCVLYVGRCVYLIHRYQDEHLSIYRCEPGVPSLSDYDDEPPEMGMHTPLPADGKI